MLHITKRVPNTRLELWIMGCNNTKLQQSCIGQTIVMPTGDRHDNTRRPSTGFFQGGLESNDLGDAR